MSASPITQRKTAQGYQSAKTRKRCETCGQKTNNYGGNMLSCNLGKFIVTAYGVCPKWELQQPPGVKRPANPSTGSP
jgi:hypothetical protein